MNGAAQELVATIRRELTPDEHANRLIARAATGQLSLAPIAALAAEETLIVASDRRSLFTLASRATSQPAIDFFSGLAQGESLALPLLPALATAAGMTAPVLRDYEPRPGCQAYPSYLAWLALNGEPAAVVLALVANFAAWGDYCRTLGAALRRDFGFDDEACAFFDFFAEPATELEDHAIAAVRAALDARVDLADARRYGRLLQSYELMFWNTLADVVS